MSDIPTESPPPVWGWGTEKSPRKPEKKYRPSSNESYRPIMNIDFTKPWDQADVCLVVDDQKLYACRKILEIWSKEFKRRFDEEYNPKETFKEDINLPGQRYDSVLEFLKVVHPTNKQISEENFHILLPVAHAFQVENIVQRCEEVLMSLPPSFHSLFLADTYQLSNLEGYCLKYTNKAPVADIEKDQYFSNLSARIKFQIMRAKARYMEEHAWKGQVRPKGDFHLCIPVEKCCEDCRRKNEKMVIGFDE